MLKHCTKSSGPQTLSVSQSKTPRTALCLGSQLAKRPHLAQAAKLQQGFQVRNVKCTQLRQGSFSARNSPWSGVAFAVLRLASGWPSVAARRGTILFGQLNGFRAPSRLRSHGRSPAPYQGKQDGLEIETGCSLANCASNRN